MKTAKEIKIDNRTYTVLECTNCGATTHVVGKLGSKKARVAQEHACATCTPRHFHRPSQGWWVAFGLDKNPYVYGPMRHSALVYASEWKKQGEWVGQPGLGTMNTKRNAKESQSQD